MTLKKGLEVRIEVQHKNKGELTLSTKRNYMKKVAQRQKIDLFCSKTDRLFDCNVTL